MDTPLTEAPPQYERETEDVGPVVDWDRMAQLRVTRTVLDALKNLELHGVFLIPANRRKDARKKFLGHGSRKMMGEAEMPLGNGSTESVPLFLSRNAAAVDRCREDFLQVVEDAVEKSEGVVRECFPGLIQIAVAVRVNDRVIGVLRCGNFGSGKPDHLAVARISEKLSPLGVNGKSLEAEIKKIPFFSSEKVAVISNLMEMLGQEISAYIEESSRDSETSVQMEKHSYRGLVTRNPLILDIIRQIKLIGQSDSSVIIYGESGTGKELIAKLIYENSNRQGKPLVTINCAALTETILEAELFGYKRGAFTGAASDKQGLFEAADTGTVFLDEVGEMSLSLQVKLLRLIQEGTFMRVGDTELRHVDVAVISATHRDLRKLIELGKFREDLYYRLAVVELTLPPLRERPEDTPILIHHFLEMFQERTGKQGIALTGDVMKIFQEYYWPGNVRELSNEIERIVALSPSHSMIKNKDLSKKFFYETYPDTVRAGDEEEEGYIKHMVEEFEKSILSKYLRKHKWNKTRVARLCGITRQGLNKKISKYRLDRRRV